MARAHDIGGVKGLGKVEIEPCEIALAAADEHDHEHHDHAPSTTEVTT